MSNKRLIITGVLVFLALSVLFSACTVDIGPGPGPGPQPVRYGTIYIVSGATGVYGEVYLNGRSYGYLYPNDRVRIPDVRLRTWHELEIVDVWGTTFRRIYPTYHGEEFRYF